MKQCSSLNVRKGLSYFSYLDVLQPCFKHTWNKSLGHCDLGLLHASQVPADVLDEEEGFV